jgi:hypothetical protein
MRIHLAKWSCGRRRERRAPLLATIALVTGTTACANPAGLPSPSTIASPPASHGSTAPPSPTAGPVTPSPRTSLTVELLDPAAFAYEAAAPAGTDGVRARAIGGTMAGWLAGGGYSSSGEARPDTDAVAWFSADGLDWERVTSPAFGGEGYQSISDVLGGPNWWALGTSQTGTPDATRQSDLLWRPREGSAWELVEPHCLEGVRCGESGVAAVQALAPAEFDDPSGRGWLLGAGFAGTRFSALRIEVDGRVSAATALPLPEWADDPAGTRAWSISRGPDSGWVITAQTPVPGDVGPAPRPVAWYSADDTTWSLLDEAALESMAAANTVRIRGTETGWFALGEQLLWSADLSTWTVIAGPGRVEWWNDLRSHRDLLVAFVDGDAPLAISRDGTTWEPLDVPGGGHPVDGDSDWETFILVGSRGPDAAAWRLLLPD